MKTRGIRPAGRRARAASAQDRAGAGYGARRRAEPGRNRSQPGAYSWRSFMRIGRRSFLGGLIAASARATDAPSRRAKVTKLFKSPEGHPNGLETDARGFW